MTRKILIGAAATLLLIVGIKAALANPPFNSVPDSSAIYQRSPDCKYPPCD